LSYAWVPGRTMDVLAARRRATLHVVPPETSSQNAQGCADGGRRRDNADGVEVLLAGRRAQPSRHGHVDNAEETAHQRW
jgi:hypothetical protein